MRHRYEQQPFRPTVPHSEWRRRTPGLADFAGSTSYLLFIYFIFHFISLSLSKIIPTALQKSSKLRMLI
jgi:hypothetical protein